MPAEIPDEAYEVAAKAIHDRECADGTLCLATPTSMRRYAELGQRAADAVWPLAFAAGRASIHAEWARDLTAEPFGPDDLAELNVRVEALARERVEAKVRAETLFAAAEFYDKCARDLHALSNAITLPNIGRQMAASTSARRQETVADELRCMAAGLDPDQVDDVTETARQIVRDTQEEPVPTEEERQRAPNARPRTSAG